MYILFFNLCKYFVNVLKQSLIIIRNCCRKTNFGNLIKKKRKDITRTHFIKEKAEQKYYKGIQWINGIFLIWLTYVEIFINLVSFQRFRKKIFILRIFLNIRFHMIYFFLKFTQKSIRFQCFNQSSSLLFRQYFLF